jgi:hypothetical protein
MVKELRTRARNVQYGHCHELMFHMQKLLAGTFFI